MLEMVGILGERYARVPTSLLKRFEAELYRVMALALQAGAV